MNTHSAYLYVIVCLGLLINGLFMYKQGVSKIKQGRSYRVKSFWLSCKIPFTFQNYIDIALIVIFVWLKPNVTDMVICALIYLIGSVVRMFIIYKILNEFLKIETMCYIQDPGKFYNEIPDDKKYKLNFNFSLFGLKVSNEYFRK